MHLAAALAKPGVAPNGPTDPVRHGSYEGTFTVLRTPTALTNYKRTVEPGLCDFARQITSWLPGHQPQTGLVAIFCQHTSTSLVIQRNADPDVVADLTDFLDRLVPEEMQPYHHTAEGPDDMTSHIRSVFTQTQVSIPIRDGKLALCTWQSVYLFEHRERGRRRSVILHLLAE
jgi:secondary thiamine-phosphate synthase enzyme